MSRVSFVRAASRAAAGCAAALVLAGCAARAAPAPWVPADYAAWQRTTDMRLDYPIPGHQERLRIIRMNPTGFAARPTVTGEKSRWDFPEGTVIVKEIYAEKTPAAGEAPAALFIMVKAPEDSHAQGGWLWLTRALPGGKESVFMGNFCVTCHANANEKHPYGDRNPREEFRDYVFFVPGGAPAAAGK